MGNSLKELLHQEMDLNNLNKKVYHSEERVAKLKKQVSLLKFDEFVSLTLCFFVSLCKTVAFNYFYCKI